MSRVTVEEVRVILPDDTQLTDQQIQAAIYAATCVVDQIAGGCADDLTEDCLKQVELYLAAHYCAATENTLSKTSETDPCCGGSVSYGFVLGKGVMGSPFGQMANTLSHNCLAEQDMMNVGIFSLGAPV